MPELPSLARSGNWPTPGGPDRYRSGSQQEIPSASWKTRRRKLSGLGGLGSLLPKQQN
ncbi:hypothetical protein P7K49_015000 [Saguinus oedipus]|uniref:Uncharacterized protein n=1 Tax=Saguinus oedipus TaxID=9490 RepID=A0ABQ9V8K7_SAGOE|nr:hypothetical protein P7K49_015000 [Saguinus oedipus]